MPPTNYLLPPTTLGLRRRRVVGATYHLPPTIYHIPPSEWAVSREQWEVVFSVTINLFSTHYSQLLTHYPMLTTHWSLTTDYYWLLAIHHSLIMYHYSLLIIHCSLLTTQCEQIITHLFLFAFPWDFNPQWCLECRRLLLQEALWQIRCAYSFQKRFDDMCGSCYWFLVLLALLLLPALEAELTTAQSILRPPVQLTALSA